MNTTHKWNSLNSYNYQMYSGESNIKKPEQQPVKDETQEASVQTNNYDTNFLNLPDGFKIGG